MSEAAASSTGADRAKHLFVFTSAGKPIFSRYGGEAADLAALYALLLVVAESPSSRGAAGGALESIEVSVTGASAALFAAPPSYNFKRPTAGDGQAGSHAAALPVVAQVVFYFHREGDVVYVMAVRRAVRPPLGPCGGNLLELLREKVRKRQRALAEIARLPPPAAEEQERASRFVDAAPTTTPPPSAPGSSTRDQRSSPPESASDDAALCRQQQRLCHAFIVSVAPALVATLSLSPGYDARRLFSPTDLDLLRGLLDATECCPALSAGAVPLAALPSAAATARQLATVLELCCSTHHGAQGDGEGEGREEEENVIFAGLLRASSCQSQSSAVGLLACVDRSRRLFGAPLLSSDVALLITFADGVLGRQGGETWAPVALPGFNGTGYVWCCASRLGAGLLLVQASASDGAFPALSAGATAVAAALSGRAAGTGPRQSLLSLFTSPPAPAPLPLAVICYYSAVYQPSDSGGGDHCGGGFSHLRRGLSAVTATVGQGTDAWAALVVEARRQHRRGFTLSPFTAIEAPLLSHGQGPPPTTSSTAIPSQCRVLLLADAQSALALTQLCNSYYRCPPSSWSVSSLTVPPAPCAAPRPYNFSRLLKAVQRSGIAELCVVVDGALTLEASWTALVAVLHDLVLPVV